MQRQVQSECTQSLNIYDSYEAWKGWDGLFTCTADQAQYFLGECRGLKIDDADVMEIGFGSGAFLAWAREQGARVAGNEINTRMLNAATEFGLELLPADFETVSEEHKGRFDTIAAFDVFEHFTLEEILSRLRATETMLRSGGHLLLRFPNGQSPFGLAPQNGDPTHQSSLSRSVFEQLIQTMDLEIICYKPAFRITGGGIMRSFIRRLRYLGRDMIANTLNAIYALQIPWDPVVVLVLRKSTQLEE